MWSALANGAAQETVKAIKKTSKIELQLQGVPMDSFQVLVGRQHRLSVEVEGVAYDLLLGNEAEALQQARDSATAAAAAAAAAARTAPAGASRTARAPSAAAAPAAAALPPSTAAGPAAASAQLVSPVAAGGGGDAAAALLPLQHFGGAAGSRALELPAAALCGPLELVLRGAPEHVGIYAPLAADVGGPVRRVLVEAGVTVVVAGLRRVALRRPLDLPRLPGQYLAEAYATVKLGSPEEGFDFAPGVLYMASQVRQAAAAAAAAAAAGAAASPGGGGKGRGQRQQQQQQQPLAPPPPLLSLEVETVAAGSMTVKAAAEEVASPPPRLKVRRLAGGTVELSLRQGQVSPAQPFSAAALSRVWAWPLPHAPMGSWLPYETLLRSVLVGHPFDVEAVARRGIGLRLVQSTVQGVHLIAFDMEVRSRQERPPELEGTTFEWNETPLEIWEAVVQVQPPAQGRAGAGGGGASGYGFVPLSVKRKASYQNTLTVSRSSMLLALAGGDNATLAAMMGQDGALQLLEL